MKWVAIIILSVAFIEMFDRSFERANEMRIAKLELAEVCIKIAYGSNDSTNTKKLEGIIKELK